MFDVIGSSSERGRMANVLLRIYNNRWNVQEYRMRRVCVCVKAIDHYRHQG
jgi:hypothetical protein